MKIEKLHNKAIEKAEYAFINKLKGNTIEANSFYEQAFNLEKNAALAAKASNVGEPSISILLKSAATLAINCSLFAEAEKLICLALSGEPPFEIAAELRDLLQEVNFDRHLILKGITLSDKDFQIVFSGDGVSHGMAKSDSILERLNTFEKISLRTIDRKSNRDFREGNFPKNLRMSYGTYYSVPRAASFSLTIKIGYPTVQIEMFKEGITGGIIDDILENISFVNEGDYRKLKENIPDEAYFKNFVSLSKELAPDGKDIKLVGFTTMREGQEKSTKFTRPRSEIIPSIVTQNKQDVNKKKSTGLIELAGRLYEANDNSKKITIESPGQSNTIITVPKGLGDIVKKYWGEQVRVRAVKKGKTLDLTDIDPF